MIEKFLLVGLKDDLPAVRDANKLYWCSDTRELYKGMDLYTEAVRIVDAVPATPAQGVLYVLPTGEAKVFNGTDTVTVAKPYVESSAGVLTAANTDDQVATAKAVYDSIVNAISTATESIVKGGALVNNIISTKAGTITVTKGEYTQVGADAVYSASVNYFEKVNDAYVLATVDASTFAAKVASGLYVSSDETDVVVKGVVVNPTYDASTRTITLPYADGTDSLVISLGKDIFVDPNADNKYNTETGNIELFLNDGSISSYEHIEITQGNPSLIKATANSVYSTDVTGYYYFDTNTNTATKATDVTAENYGEKVAAGLYIKLAASIGYAFPNVTSIYVKESDGTYTEVPVTTSLYRTILNTSGDIYFGISSQTKISIPASDLVDIYTGETSADGSTTVSVSADNKITASVNVSADAGNKLVKKADGLYVDAVAQADFDILDDQVNSVQTQVVLKENGTATGASYTYSADDKFLVDGVETTIASDADLSTTLADTGVNSVVAVVGEDGIAKRLTTAEAGIKTNADAIDKLSKDVTDTIAALDDIHIDEAADNKYNAETGNVELYLNDGTTSTVTNYEALETATMDSTDQGNYGLGDPLLVKFTSQAKYVEGKTIYILDSDGNCWSSELGTITTEEQFNSTKLSSYASIYDVNDFYPDVTSAYETVSVPGEYTEQSTGGDLASLIQAGVSSSTTMYLKSETTVNTQTKIEVPVTELKAAITAIDTINTTLKDGIYVEVATTDKFDTNTTYFVLSDGEFVVDSSVSGDNFAAKVEAGLYMIASDAIELLAAKVDANTAAIATNASAVEGLSYVECTANSVYVAGVTYYKKDDTGAYVEDTSVTDDDTLQAAVTAGNSYVLTKDAVKVNESRIKAIEVALTWGTF